MSNSTKISFAICLLSILSIIFYVTFFDSNDEEVAEFEEAIPDDMDNGDGVLSIVASAQDELVAIDHSKSNDVAVDFSPSFVDKFKSYERASDDPKSQIAMYDISLGCEQIDDITYEYLDEIEGDEEVTHEYALQLRKEFSDCQSLKEYLGGISFKEYGHAWLETAADTHSVAKLLSLYEYPEEPNPNDVLPLLYESFALTSNDPLLEDKVFNAALNYFRNNIEPTLIDVSKIDETNYRRGTVSDAWDYLVCEKSINCDLNQHLAMYQKYFSDTEKDLMIDKANELITYINNENWDSLGLDMPEAKLTE